jgi:hypothetical protein
MTLKHLKREAGFYKKANSLDSNEIIQEPSELINAYDDDNSKQNTFVLNDNKSTNYELTTFTASVV